jgi:hypothetical protein
MQLSLSNRCWNQAWSHLRQVWRFHKQCRQWQLPCSLSLILPPLKKHWCRHRSCTCWGHGDSNCTQFNISTVSQIIKLASPTGIKWLSVFVSNSALAEAHRILIATSGAMPALVNLMRKPDSIWQVHIRALSKFANLSVKRAVSRFIALLASNSEMHSQLLQKSVIVSHSFDSWSYFAFTTKNICSPNWHHQVPHGKQDPGGFAIHCEGSPPGPHRRWNQTFLIPLGQSLGSCFVRRSWHESSFHDFTFTLDGRFL